MFTIFKNFHLRDVLVQCQSQLRNNPSLLDYMPLYHGSRFKWKMEMVDWLYTCLGQFSLIYYEFSIWLVEVMFVLCLCRGYLCNWCTASPSICWLYQFVWSHSTISFFSITVWLHYWTLFSITIVWKCARTVSGKVSWYFSLGSTKRTSTHFKSTNAWGNKCQHQNSDCSNCGRTATHGVYKQQKEVASFHWCRMRSICTLVAIIRDDRVEFLVLQSVQTVWFVCYINKCIWYSICVTWLDSPFLFFFFSHWTSFNGWKLWPSQWHFSISLDPERRLSNFWPSFGKCPVWRYPPFGTWVFLAIFWLEDSI